MMSRSLRQSVELMDKCATHLKAIDAYVTRELGRPSIIDKIGAVETVLANGATIRAMPCDPDTTAGYTVNWLLDEAALYPNSDRVFATVKPSILHGKRMMIVSSPRGYQNFFGKVFYKFFQTGKSPWSIHLTPLDAAVRDGLILRDHDGRPTTIEAFLEADRETMPEEMIQQEYFCKFLSTLQELLTSEVVRGSAMRTDRTEITPGELRDFATKRRKETRGAVEFPFGIDIGRYHDRTVLWVSEKSASTYYPVCIVDTRDEPLASQTAKLSHYISALQTSGAPCNGFIDATGIGAGVAEALEALHPGIVVPLTFTNSVKSILSGRMRILMQAGRFWIPAAREDIVDDFLSVRQTVSAAGNVRVGAPRGPNGHADYFWAAAMSAHAGEAVESCEVAIA